MTGIRRLAAASAFALSLAFLSAPASAQFTVFDRTDDLPSYHRKVVSMETNQIER